MSITDELREWWVRKFPIMDAKLHKDFTAIADRIDEEHESACGEAYGNGVMSVVGANAVTLGATDARPTQAESSGTCHDVWDIELTGRLRFQCSECGAVSLEITPNFCPVCGRKVVEPTTNDVDAEVDS